MKNGLKNNRNYKREKNMLKRFESQLNLHPLGQQEKKNHRLQKYKRLLQNQMKSQVMTNFHFKFNYLVKNLRFENNKMDANVD